MALDNTNYAVHATKWDGNLRKRTDSPFVVVEYGYAWREDMGFDLVSERIVYEADTEHDAYNEMVRLIGQG